MRNVKCMTRLIQTTSLGLFYLLVSLISPSVASAADFSWTLYLNGNPNQGGFSSPQSACEQLNTINNRNLKITTQKTSETSFQCYEDGSESRHAARRQGDSCPQGATYNSSTGTCDKPVNQCDSLKGQSTFWKRSYTKEGYSGLTTMPYMICSNSCYAEVQSGECGTNTSGAGACYGLAKYTGSPCSGDGSDKAASTCTDSSGCKSALPAPSASADNKCTTKVTDAEGRVHYTCQTSNQFSNPENLNCGTVNGQVVCTKKTQASSKDSKTTSESTETSNSDGSTTTTTNSNNTTTKCDGVNSCSTTTNTTVSNSTKQKDGTTTSESSQCTGTNCKKDKESEEEEKKPSVGGEACDAPLTCSGDAIQCAMLKQQKLQQCQQEKFQKVDADELKKTVNDAFSGDEYKPLDKTLNKYDVGTMLDTSSRFSSACPKLPDAVISFNGVSQAIPFSTDEICKYAAWFGYLMVAFAMYRAALIATPGAK